MNDLCNVSDICWSAIEKREGMSTLQFDKWIDGRNAFHRAVRRTRPIQGDADAAVFNSVVVGVVAVRLAHHQFISEVLMEMNNAPDVTPTSGFYSFVVIIEGDLHYGRIVYGAQVSTTVHVVFAFGRVVANFSGVDVKFFINNGYFQKGRVASNGQAEENGLNGRQQENEHEHAVNKDELD